MAELDPGLYPFIDGCLALQALFLNVLWVALAWNRYFRADRLPGDRVMKRYPRQAHLVVALVVWAVILAGTLYGFQAAHWFLGFALANGAFLSVLDPVLALCFTLSMLMMRPWEIMEPNAVILLVPKFSTIFSFGWALYYFWRVDRGAFRVNRVVLLSFAYLIWLLLSTLMTPDPNSARASLTGTMAPYITLVFLIYHLARSRFSAWALKQSLIAVLTCVGLISIYFFVSGYRVTGRIVAFGAFTNSNDIAAVMMIPLPLAAAAFYSARSSFSKVLYAFCVVVALIVLALAQSRGAVIAVAAGGAGYALRRLKNKGVAVVVVALVLLGAQLATKLFNRDQADLGGSTNNRSIFWAAGIRMGLYNPVFGMGYNEFPANVEAYATETPEEQGLRTAHSAWILAFAESGFVGLLLFLSIYYFGCLKPSLAMYSKDPGWFYVGLMYATTITFLSQTYYICPYLISIVATVSYLAEFGDHRARS